MVGDDVRGIAVHIDARSAALASAVRFWPPAPSSIWSQDLVSGSETGVTHELKGVPGEWKIFAVDG